MIFDDKLANLAQAYLKAWRSGEFDNDPNEVRYRELINERQEWLRNNIIDTEKLRSYTDAEFEEKIYEMINHTEGGNSTHARVRGKFRSFNPDITAVRKKFENIINFINNPKIDKFEIIATFDKKEDVYNIKGLGDNSLTALVNAKYPEVPIVNNATEIFFKSIGMDLPKKGAERQKMVHEIFSDMIKSANDEIDFIDANHICWYTQKVDSGIEFMKVNFPATYIEPDSQPRKVGRVRRRKLTPEEEREELIKHLTEIHEQAERERASKM